MSSQHALIFFVVGIFCAILIVAPVAAAFDVQDFLSFWIGRYADLITGRQLEDPPLEVGPDSIRSGAAGGTPGDAGHQPQYSPQYKKKGIIVIVTDKGGIEFVHPSFPRSEPTGGGGTGASDLDGDGIPDLDDNCPTVINPQQSDCDGDQIGDACDIDYPISCGSTGGNSDADSDGVPDFQDNCPYAYNPDQTDTDGDAAGDMCDICPQHRLHDEDGDSFLNSACVGGTDCNDQNSIMYPGAVELCDNRDNNCNNMVDESGCVACAQVNNDADPAPACTDCNDHDYSVYPGAPEMCWDFKDNDCNGNRDCDDAACMNDPICLRRCDVDGDGHASISCSGDDCNDNDFTVYNGAIERKDGVDNDCNGVRDDMIKPILQELPIQQQSLVTAPAPQPVAAQTISTVSTHLDQITLHLREAGDALHYLDDPRVVKIARHVIRTRSYVTAVNNGLRSGSMTEQELRLAINALRSDVKQLRRLLET